MKKKTIANLVMVAIIVLIGIAGVLGVGHIQGWFDIADGTQAVLGQIRGVIQLERGGVSYQVQSDTVLRTGDRLTCQSGGTAVITNRGGTLTIGEKAVLTVTDPAADRFSAEVSAGEVFVNCESQVKLTFAGKEICLSQTTVLLSVRSGAQSISVLRGSVSGASAGQIISFIGTEQSIGTLNIQSLNDFTITQMRHALDTTPLCFTAQDLDRLAADRQQAMQDLINSQTKPTEPPTEPTEPEQGTDVTEPSKPAETTPPPVPPAGSCTIAIYCDTILHNMDSLSPGKAEFVPGDGVILYPVTVDFYEGETVFDVLKRVCDIVGIPLEYSWTPLYDSYYVEGIHQLYEFDCGFESGWMYKVNGWFPNYGCSSYFLKDGDVIVWAYTCKGLGSDLGAPRMDD